MAASLSEGVCDTCRRNKIKKIEDCNQDKCIDGPPNRKHGWPRKSSHMWEGDRYYHHHHHHLVEGLSYAQYLLPLFNYRIRIKYSQ